MSKGRPNSKNVFYFPHYTKGTSELDLIEYRYGSEGYKAYYRLQELVADADYHRLSLATQDDKDMFDLGMNCKQEVVDDVIKILLDKGRIDRELWEDERVIWMQDFVDTLKPVYVNRKKPLPNKNIVPTSNNSIFTSNNSISTGSNTEKRKEKKTKEKGSKDFPRINDKKQMENPNSSPDVIKLYQLFISDNNISPSKSDFSIVSEALDRQPLEFWKPIIANYQKSGEKKVAKFFFESDYTKFLPHSSISHTFKCPMDGCDTQKTSDSKDLYSLCKKHPEEGNKRLVLIKY